MKIQTKKIFNLIEYGIALFIVLDCRSVYTVMTGVSLPIQSIVIVLCTVYFLLNFCLNKKGLARSQVKIVAFLLLYFVVFFGVNVLYTSGRVDFIIRFPMFMGLLLLCSHKNEDPDFMTRLLLKYSNIIVLLALISLFFWGFGSVLRMIPAADDISYYWGTLRESRSYLGLYFETNKDLFLFKELYRNNGVFTEAPMHALNLSIALAVIMFIDKKNSDKMLCKKSIVLIAAIISTISLTGIGCVVIAYIVKILFGREDRYRMRKLLLSCTLIMGVMFFLPSLLMRKTETMSYSYRIDDYIVGFRAWCDNLIFGGGYGVRNYINYLSEWRRNNTGYSNSLLWILSQGGIWLFLVYAVPCIAIFIKNCREKRRTETFFLLVILYLMLSTSFAYQMILVLIVSRWIWNVSTEVFFRKRCVG